MYHSPIPKSAVLGGLAVLLLALKLAKGRRSNLLLTPDDVGTPLSDLPSVKDAEAEEYDFVIIGGGTASLVLANRLSASPNVRVLVLEAGQSGVAVAESRVPALFLSLMRSKHDWRYKTIRQPGLDGRKLEWTRTKLLGGCSSGNAMMFNFGAPEDYDEWAEKTGASDWSYANLKKYILRLEHFVPHPDVPMSGKERGKGGPMKSGYFGFFTSVGQIFMDACEAVGIPKVEDVNTSSGALGATRTPSFIDPQGRRVSTESAYLTRDVLSRPNLKVATGAHVTKIRFSVVNGVKRAVGVEFTSGKGGPIYYAKAKREVLLTAGATNSPQILMLSGVGPAQELQKHGIPVLHDLPGVGQNLLDHLVLNIRFRTFPGHAYAQYKNPRGLVDTLVVLRYVLQYRLFSTGLLTMHTQQSIAFARTNDPKLFPAPEFSPDYEDTTSGEGAPDIEIMASPLAWLDHGLVDYPHRDVMSISVVLLRPSSSGTVTLRSSDPFDSPVIDPRYLSTKRDLEGFKRGAKLCARIALSEPYAPIVDRVKALPELDHFLEDLPEEELDKLVKSRVQTLYHPVGTTKMGPLSDGGVVDAKLRVHGIEGLRIVDAGIMPTIVAGHTAGPTVAIAEKASDMIKAAWPQLYRSK